MIREERLLKVLRSPHVSEKASAAMEKNNTIVLKVAKDATKAEIKLQCRNCLKSKSKTLTPCWLKARVSVTVSVLVVVATGKKLTSP